MSRRPLRPSAPAPGSYRQTLVVPAAGADTSGLIDPSDCPECEECDELPADCGCDALEGLVVEFLAVSWDTLGSDHAIARMADGLYAVFGIEFPEGEEDVPDHCAALVWDLETEWTPDDPECEGSPTIRQLSPGTWVVEPFGGEVRCPGMLAITGTVTCDEIEIAVDLEVSVDDGA